MTLKASEINIFYGHECYALISGKEFCDCEECAQIRPKIYEAIWRDIAGKKRKVYKGEKK